MSEPLPAGVILEQGWCTFPASLQTPANTPRFRIGFPEYLLRDLGAVHLYTSESQDGYEPVTRALIERVLRRGDLFIDVGAHWGYFTLQAVTHPAGGIRAMAFEPDPANAAICFTNLLNNGVTPPAQLICAACGDIFDLAPLVTNASMGHSVRAAALKEGFAKGPPKFVMCITLDSALGCFPHAASGRVILKIDAEGYEAKVITGAEKLLDSGRASLIIWERGTAYSDGPEREEMLKMVQSLSRRGYRHWRDPQQSGADSLVPFEAQEPYVGNVFSALPELTL